MSESKKFQSLLKKHLRLKGTANEKTIKYRISELQELCATALEIFREEPSLCEINPPVVIVGDVHGQFEDLLRMFSLFNEDGTHGALCNKFVFLGDYVDRGSRSLECIALVLLLKVNFPKKFMLLRGNHECKLINKVYGFYDEIVNRFDKDEAESFFTLINEVFDYMPIAGLVGKRILCMHGGISQELNSFDDIRNISRPLEDPSVNTLAMDLMWSDPMNELNGYRPNKNRGVSFHFGENAVKDTCTKLGLDLIVRGHQMMINGYGFFANRKLCTIFTAPKYQADTNNKGAVMFINHCGKVGFKVLKGEDNSDDTDEKSSTSGPTTRMPPKKKKANLRKFQSASCTATQGPHK